MCICIYIYINQKRISNYYFMLVTFIYINDLSDRRHLNPSEVG